MALSTTHSASSIETRTRSSRSVLRRAFDSLIDARQRAANRRVNGYLLALDDQTLTELGYDRKKLIREGAVVHSIF